MLVKPKILIDYRRFKTLCQISLFWYPTRFKKCLVPHYWLYVFAVRTKGE